MGCGNAVQTAKEEFGHIKRENDEMRTNLNQLRVRADTSSLHLSREQQKAAELNAALELTQAALRALGKTLAEVQRQCFGGGMEWDLSAPIEPEKLVEKVERIVEDFQQNAVQFIDDISNIMRDSAAILQVEDNSACIQPLLPAIHALWSSLQSCIHHKDMEICDLRKEISRQKSQLAEQQELTASLEQTLASQGFHLASCDSASLSFEEEVEVCSSASPSSSD
jgi:hypothetical protein